MARPTKKAAALVFGAMILFFIGSNVQAGWLYVLGASMVGVVVAGLVMPRFGLRGLEVVRAVPVIARAGDSVPVTLHVVNPGAAVSSLTGVDLFLEPAQFFAECVPAADRVEFHYEVACDRRGVFEGADVVVRSSAPFGFGTASRRFSVESPLIVHPRWVNLASFPLLEAASAPNEEIHERPRRGAGMEFFGIREYRSGDSLRHVHWRSTARAGRLLVREFEELLASRVGVFIDSSEVAGKGSRTTFEDSVSAAASIVLYALAAGHPAQLFCGGSKEVLHLFEPSRRDALDWLARLEDHGRSGLDDLVAKSIGEVQRRSTNVLIFPSTQQAVGQGRAAVAMLQERSTRVIAVVVSASSYAPKDSRVLTDAEEDRLLKSLTDDRVLVYRIDKEKELSECLKEPQLV